MSIKFNRFLKFGSVTLIMLSSLAYLAYTGAQDGKSYYATIDELNKMWPIDVIASRVVDLKTKLAISVTLLLATSIKAAPADFPRAAISALFGSRDSGLQ